MALNRFAARVWLPVLAALLLLAACGTWLHQQQNWQRRQALERCQKRRAAIEQQLGRFEVAQQTLRQIDTARYRPSPAPEPIDPERASRFSQLDRQLDAERYAAARNAWMAQERQRQALWRSEQQQRREQARQRRDQAIEQLGQIEPSLVSAGAPDPAQVASLSNCGQQR
jgi:hypothetical protein